MKTLITILTISLCLCCGYPASSTPAPEDEARAITEYATLRWGGRDETHVIYANGKVEFLGSKFKGIKKPDRADERAFYMNLAMNALAREGYELVAMTPDDYVFKRLVKR